MNISGTLHLYSGTDRELFFTFDDDIAQKLYASGKFDLDDKETRRTYLSVGRDRFIHRRTLSFSKKQSEIKVSLCKKTTSQGHGALTWLYDWFAPAGMRRPKVVSVVGQFRKARFEGKGVWELLIQEPAGDVAPSGLKRRRKSPSKVRREYLVRRMIVLRETAEVGRKAEHRAFAIAKARFREPTFQCLWRKEYLDSEKDEVRSLGVICDIDIWNTRENRPEAFIEVNAQIVGSSDAKKPLFYLSRSEWRSYKASIKNSMKYLIWLIQYRSLAELEDESTPVRVLEFREIDKKWLDPEVLLVRPTNSGHKLQ